MNKSDIDQAARTIGDHIVHTPVVHSSTLSNLTGCTAYFKLEQLQMTGSFKERGALNRLSALNDDERKCGVIAASAGNHAQGVALHTQRLGIASTIVMPENTPLIKVISTEHYGARVILHGQSYTESEARAREIAEDEGQVFIHAFDDDLVIAGQGTIGREIMEHETGSEIDAVICPIGGGGLISGIACYIKETRPDIRIIGVQTESFPSMERSRMAGKVIEAGGAGSLADGIAVRRVSERTRALVKHYVDDIMLVNEDEIANAVMLFLEIEKIVVEGAGAVPLAALLNRNHGLTGKRVLSVCSGGNIDVNMLSRIIQRGLAVDGRISCVQLVLRDYPGSLADALTVIRNERANVLSVEHHRVGTSTPVGLVAVSIFLETRGHKHIRAIREALNRQGIMEGSCDGPETV